MTVQRYTAADLEVPLELGPGDRFSIEVVESSGYWDRLWEASVVVRAGKRGIAYERDWVGAIRFEGVRDALEAEDDDSYTLDFVVTRELALDSHVSGINKARVGTFTYVLAALLVASGVFTYEFVLVVDRGGEFLDKSGDELTRQHKQLNVSLGIALALVVVWKLPKFGGG